MEHKRAHRPILRLPEEVIGKIAAGEVVESPSAAIKELVENSVDAGATAITIETKEGGIAYFRVTDNGCGIPAGDIRMAFERHATSKLRTSDELFDVRSLGFRGEALASIAAVSKLTLTTRTAQDDRGTKAVNVGGIMQPVQDAASAEGTTIVVQDLFFNTPARLKFLKKPSTEGARVADMVLRMLLANPGVSFRLIQNEKQIYHSPGDGKLRSAIFSVYGLETTQQLMAIQGNDGGVSLDGFVGIGPVARGNRTHQSFFINGRYVRSATLTQALETACRERVLTGQFPLCMLHVRLPPNLVDVNVHPNKLEVRFSDEKFVAECVEHIVRDALCTDAIQSAPRLTLGATEPERQTAPVRVESVAQTVPSFGDVVQDFFSTMPAPPLRVRESAASVSVAPAQGIPFAAYPSSGTTSPRDPAPAVSAPIAAPPKATVIETVAPFRIVGVLFQTYIVVEQGESVLLIDQHAAHERILYERLSRSLDQGEGSQQLLVAQVISVTPLEKELLHTYEESVRGAGYEFDFFGEDAVQVRAVPTIMGEPDAKQGFLAVLDQLGDLRMLATKEKRREAIVQMSCKRAVKGGDVLTTQEIEALLLDMQRSEAPPTCPHGRPLVVLLPRTELEKRFKRIV